jgi:branched-chain amino acid transport system permease protein
MAGFPTSPRAWFNALLLALCALVPVVAPALGEPFYINVFARTMIWAIAAVSLNLIMGYGGMISFGHAVYLGIGGYTVGILTFHGIESAYVQWPLALVLSALVALVFGAISLRTRGVYFIMITLALAQMLYFLAVSAHKYGSDDGLTIGTRSDFALPWFDLNDRTTFYYVTFAILVACLYVSKRLVESRFGMAIRGAKSNQTRMEAIGFSTYRYKLAAFVIAGTMCGLAGVLTANFEKYISPDMMNWPRSGEMIFMVVLGGMGSLFGPLGGAVAYWVLSEVLSSITVNWHLIFGPFLVLVVLFARGGIDGMLGRRGGTGGGAGHG